MKKKAAKNKIDNFWLATSMGEKAVDFQKSAQITWWSILQGVSVATLVDKLPNVASLAIQEQKWHLILFVIMTFMIIVNVWVQMAWAILIYRWHLNLIHTALILLLGVTTQLTCAYVESPQYWALAVASVTISATIVYAYNINHKVLLDLPEQKVKPVIALYIGYTILSLFAAFTMMQNPTVNIQLAWSFIFFIAVIGSWKVQLDNMNFERRQRNIP